MHNTANKKDSHTDYIEGRTTRSAPNSGGFHGAATLGRLRGGDFASYRHQNDEASFQTARCDDVGVEHALFYAFTMRARVDEILAVAFRVSTRREQCPAIQAKSKAL